MVGGNPRYPDRAPEIGARMRQLDDQAISAGKFLWLVRKSYYGCPMVAALVRSLKEARMEYGMSSEPSSAHYSH